MHKFLFTKKIGTKCDSHRTMQIIVRTRLTSENRNEKAMRSFDENATITSNVYH